jgi:hypothetical protein
MAKGDCDVARKAKSGSRPNTVKKEFLSKIFLDKNYK